MKISIIGTHSWPVPYKTHTGDYFYALLAQTLDEMGHDVNFFAPNGSYVPPNGKFYQVTCAWGTATPNSQICETECYNKYKETLQSSDVVHDFSITKLVSINLMKSGYRNVVMSPMGGTWMGHDSPNNLVLFSRAMRDRWLRGATDYESTPTPDMGGHAQSYSYDSHVVHLGIDTDFYSPTYKKEDYYLWMGRWHPIRGYRFAIDLAKKTGIKLVMSGEHPDREMFDYQRQCALEAIDYAKGWNNIVFDFLPEDPHHHTYKRELLRSAKAFIYSVQFQEPFGLSQVEAMACGTPVVATNYGSMPEVIENGVTGFVVPNDIDEFAAAIEKVRGIDPHNCRARAVNCFDRSVMANSFLKEYNKIINGENW